MSKTKFVKKHTVTNSRTGIRYNMVFIKWVGDRKDLGLVKGEMYTYKALGKAVGITAGSMRGRLRGILECTDNLMWANGEVKPRSEWVSATDFPRLETEADKMSQKYLRMSL